MGTFANIYGNQNIKEELKEEYIENVLKVLKAGGMMQFEKVNLYGKEIALLKELEPNEKGWINFHYNYFGDEAWETAGFNIKTGEFYSNKIGWSEFCDVILAVYVLTEFYTKDFSIAEINGDIFDGKEILGWLNYVLNKDYTNIRATNAFNILKVCPNPYKDNIYEIVQNCGTDEAINLGSLISYLYFKKNELPLWDSIIKELKNKPTNGNIRPTDMILKIEKPIDALKENGKSFEEILELCFDCENFIKNISEDEKKEKIHEYSFSIIGIFCPKINILIYLCEIFEKNFWEQYQIYKDKLKTNADKIWEGNISKLSPINKIKTANYLDTPDSALCFMHTEFKENYHLSDDDFTMFWTENSDLEFSNDFNNWCESLTKDFLNIKENIEIINVQDFIKELIETLEIANIKYKRIYAPNNLFYELLSNAQDKNYQTALKLFQKLLEDNYKEGKIIEDIGSWDVADKNKTFNKGRLNIKRYLALLSNKELRNKIFGF